MEENNSFYDKRELDAIGFKNIGYNVLISRYARFYTPSNVSIGNNVRIDDFCILSGNIIIEDFVHISAFCALYGKGGITLKNYSGMSPRSTIFSQTDDFSGDFLIGPMVEKQKTNIITGPVILNEFVQLGANTIVFPNIEIGKGSVTGAFTLVNKSLKQWSIYTGIPAKKLKNRNSTLLQKLNF